MIWGKLAAHTFNNPVLEERAEDDAAEKSLTARWAGSILAAQSQQQLDHTPRLQAANTEEKDD